MEIREVIYGKQHSELADSFHNLAVLYRAQGRYDEAEERHLEALKIREGIFADGDRWIIAETHNSLAALYYEKYSNVSRLSPHSYNRAFFPRPD